MSEKLRIALLGTRGIPARYGGFETFAEQLSTRLVKRGHEVTVYSRRSLFQSYSGPNEYHGVNIRVAPTVMHKYLETPLHALFSFIDLLWLRPDVVLLCNAANSPFAFLVRMQFIPLAINVDGIERNRAKWSIVGKAWYKLGEICSVIFGSVVVADAEVIARYYRDKFNIAPNVIAYGAEAETVEAGEVLAKFGLKPGEYILYVSRLEPENNALGVIQAYSLASTTLPLVIVGDAPYAHAYKEKLLDAARRSGKADSIIFTGFQFERAYHELQSHAGLYIQATEVGGTHPALIEAMAYANPVIANGTPENEEVRGDSGLLFKKNDFADLAYKIDKLLGDTALAKELRHKSKARANQVYSWDSITDQYEALLFRLAKKRLRNVATVK